MTIPLPPEAALMGSPEGAYVVPVDLDPQPNLLGDYPLNPDEAVLESNAGRCLECLVLERGRVNACPRDHGHTVEPVHASVDGLGYANDADFYNADSLLYEYPAVPGASLG